MGCRVVRQAFILAQITGRQVKTLEKRDDPVYGRLWTDQKPGVQSSASSTLQMILGIPQNDVHPVSIALTTNLESPMLQDKRLDLVVPQIKAWLDNCRLHHKTQCGNLSWSLESPRRLIEITSESELKLIDASERAKLDYVALSYCWGDGSTLANTTWRNLASRQLSFAIRDLPPTIRDALILVKRLGLKYMWIDQICIVQKSKEEAGEDWDLEGSRMHIVYGNALFTLSACSSESSTDGLFRPRKAWTYPVSPFYFEGQWLVNFDMSLGEVRARAPLSTRAWVLQEERLSPRVLYYCDQRVYWSCFVDQHMELSTSNGSRIVPSGRPYTHGSDYARLSEAQAFLGLRFDGDKIKLHREWHDLVESYCMRHMTQATDRFRAISGLAAQSLSVYVTKDNEIYGQEYLAGLWRATFAEDLAWSVDRACDPLMALTDLAPSWSWASLPLRTRIKAKEPFEKIGEFCLLEAPESSGSAKNEGLGSGAVVLEACRNGAEKRCILVRGHLQQVMNRSSMQIDWSEMRVNHDSQIRYDFSGYINQHIYARNMANGKIVIHEPNKRPMEVQLDYLCPQGSHDSGSWESDVQVALGAERDLYGLQIGKRTMLLLQPDLAHSMSGSETRLLAYRRVGLCRNILDGFFDGVESVDLELV